MSLITDQKLALEQRSATMGSRAGAYILDLLWVVLIPLVIQIVFTAAAAGALNHGDYSAYGSLISLSLWIPLVLRLVLIVVYLATLGSGQTPGMKAAKIRLVRVETMGEPGFWRVLGRLIIFSLTWYIVVGPFTPLFDSSGARRGWHDNASSTWMLKADALAELTPAAAPAPASAPASALAPAPAPAPAFSLPPAPGPAPAPALAPAPAPALAPAPAPARLPFAAANDDDDLDSTRAAPPVRVAARWSFVLDSGDVVQVTRSGLIGRNPESGPDESAQLVPVLDLTKSISKTHLAFVIDGSRLGVTDRHSTNGTRVARSGEPEIVVGVDSPTFLRAGDVLILGDRRITVSAT